MMSSLQMLLPKNEGLYGVSVRWLHGHVFSLSFATHRYNEQSLLSLLPHQGNTAGEKAEIVSNHSLCLCFKMRNSELRGGTEQNVWVVCRLKSIHFFYPLPRIEISRSEGRSLKGRQEEPTERWAQFPSFWEGSSKRWLHRESRYTSQLPHKDYCLGKEPENMLSFPHEDPKGFG